MRPLKLRHEHRLSLSKLFQPLRALSHLFIFFLTWALFWSFDFNFFTTKKSTKLLPVFYNDIKRHSSKTKSGYRAINPDVRNIITKSLLRDAWRFSGHLVKQFLAVTNIVSGLANGRVVYNSQLLLVAWLPSTSSSFQPPIPILFTSLYLIFGVNWTSIVGRHWPRVQMTILFVCMETGKEVWNGWWQYKI